eukprot:SAG31_NODE_643_length_13291_cov_6.294042_6_plen_296_part_00
MTLLRTAAVPFLPSFFGCSAEELDWLLDGVRLPKSKNLDNDGPKLAARTPSLAADHVEMNALADRVQDLEAQLTAHRNAADANLERQCRLQAEDLLGSGRRYWQYFSYGSALAGLGLFAQVRRGSRCARWGLGVLGAVWGSALCLRHSRLVHGFWVAGIIWRDYRSARTLAERLPDAEVEGLYDSLHRTHAHFAHASIVSLQGWWIKVGQYLSSRADVMPPPFLRTLSKLQDEIPPRPLEDVKWTIRTEMKHAENQTKSVAFEMGHQLQAAVDPNPLAAASIAQVVTCLPLAAIN